MWYKKKNVIHTHDEILSSLKKEWNIDACYNMDEPQKHYAKWMKSYTKDYMLPTSIYMKSSKKVKLKTGQVKTGQLMP